MLTKPATPELLRKWKADYAAYRPLLRPNRRPADELLAYLTAKYPLLPLDDETAREVVCANVRDNAYFASRLPAGVPPRAETFTVARVGAGEALYAAQDAIFACMDIFVGIEMVTGHFHVEGSSLLWDELFLFRGLDEADLENPCLVSEYASLLFLKEK